MYQRNGHLPGFIFEDMRACCGGDYAFLSLKRKAEGECVRLRLRQRQRRKAKAKAEAKV